MTNDDSVSRPFGDPPVIVNYSITVKSKNRQEKAQYIRRTHVLRRPERRVEVRTMPELPEIETIKNVIEPHISECLRYYARQRIKWL